jgi:hypothetical protein
MDVVLLVAASMRSRVWKAASRIASCCDEHVRVLQIAEGNLTRLREAYAGLTCSDRLVLLVDFSSIDRDGRIKLAGRIASSDMTSGHCKVSQVMGISWCTKGEKRWEEFKRTVLLGFPSKAPPEYFLCALPREDWQEMLAGHIRTVVTQGLEVEGKPSMSHCTVG